MSGPDGSRHSSDQHPKDVNSENSNYCPIFVRDFLSSRRKIPEVWKCCVFTVFEFLSHLPRNSRASRGRKFQLFVFFVFCGLRLLRACLKAPALTGYVGDAQGIFRWIFWGPFPWNKEKQNPNIHSKIQGPFSLEKIRKKNRNPKIHSKIQI